MRYDHSERVGLVFVLKAGCKEESSNRQYDADRGYRRVSRDYRVVIRRHWMPHVDACLIKPFPLRDLVHAVRALVGNAA